MRDCPLDFFDAATADSGDAEKIILAMSGQIVDVSDAECRQDIAETR